MSLFQKSSCAKAVFGNFWVLLGNFTLFLIRLFECRPISVKLFLFPIQKFQLNCLNLKIVQNRVLTFFLTVFCGISKLKIRFCVPKTWFNTEHQIQAWLCKGRARSQAKPGQLVGVGAAMPQAQLNIYQIVSKLFKKFA